MVCASPSLGFKATVLVVVSWMNCVLHMPRLRYIFASPGPKHPSAMMVSRSALCLPPNLTFMFPTCNASAVLDMPCLVVDLDHQLVAWVARFEYVNQVHYVLLELGIPPKSFLVLAVHQKSRPWSLQVRAPLTLRSSFKVTKSSIRRKREKEATPLVLERGHYLPRPFSFLFSKSPHSPHYPLVPLACERLVD